MWLWLHPSTNGNGSRQFVRVVRRVFFTCDKRGAGRSESWAADASKQMNARASDSWWSLCVATGVGAAVGVAAASVWWKTRPPRVRRGEPRKPCDPSVCGHVANIVVDPYSPHPRSDYLSWEDYFMALAVLSAMRSKDPNRQVRFSKMASCLLSLCTE